MQDHKGNVINSKHVVIRSYDEDKDCARVEDLVRRCEVGPAGRGFLYTDTLGDPICRIRNSPVYEMLVAEMDNELVGVIQGSIKVVTIQISPRDMAKVGYVLGLRVAPTYRRKRIGSSLVCSLEDWFVSNGVEYAYMATEKDNEASVQLFVDRLGYTQFRSPSILVNPVNQFRRLRISSSIEIKKLTPEDAVPMYKRCLGSAEFFPHDIDTILNNKLSLGTWVAYYKTDPWKSNSNNNNYNNNSNSSSSINNSTGFSDNGRYGPSNWAMLSVWNSGELFKLRLGNAPLSCMIYTKSSKLMDRFLPCFKVPSIPDFFSPFGFYFIYGLHSEGTRSGKLVRNLCRFVHNMATKSSSKDCKAIVTEVGSGDRIRVHIPHWKLLSCPEDLWCIKAMRGKERGNLHQLTTTPPTAPLFVDPREV
ncbi:probable N-acetyltransferase HLS1-like [Punica granatum]|uniref:N-acetyltransferase domain-containing protein n=2 Tax=Punica granatum TaxID=22663 RepID=A0A218W363_PUNGR|nr:probable N-acetyltransferase HLS1-like [Punica granatum]OWM66681.1 hypothetical protein CDL15_Pgr010332 [Punica granatum]PKI51291.1 hypothetical protein CRG98_028320 [Punica granatum]